MSTTSPTAGWSMSFHSEDGGRCVEIAARLTACGGIVRTVPAPGPQSPARPQPAATTTAFSSFVAGAKTGRFGGVA